MLISRKPEMQQIYDSGQFQYETETQQRKVIKGFKLKRSLIELVSVKSKRKYFAFFSKLSYPASRLKLQHDLPG